MELENDIRIKTADTAKAVLVAVKASGVLLAPEVMLATFLWMLVAAKIAASSDPQANAACRTAIKTVLEVLPGPMATYGKMLDNLIDQELARGASHG